jgi:transglutaminase-like putative cysteine protease
VLVRVVNKDISSQKGVLLELAKLTARSVAHPTIRQAALAITADLEARDDAGELQAIFDAVKTGTDKVSALANGLRYVADPRSPDYFTAPHRMLELCSTGACGGDCDDHAALNAALCASIGFPVGLRAWGAKGDPDFSHVYCVVGFPKRTGAKVLGMDTTVPESTVGWEPPNGHILTAWIED